jgi:hypothetical protein
MGETLLPRGEELAIARPGRERQVELRALGQVAADLVRMTGARVEEVAVLVDVDDDQVRVGLVRIVTGSVMHVDADVADARDSEARAHVDDHAEIVEHAEAGRAAARGAGR